MKTDRGLSFALPLSAFLLARLPDPERAGSDLLGQFLELDPAFY
jgi:hypothetical protein